MTSMVRSGCIVVALALAGAGLSHGQFVFRSGSGGASDASAVLDAAPAGFGVGGWTVGEWARYNLTQSMGPAGSVIRFRTVSVVGQQDAAFWVEVQEEATGLMRAQLPVRKLLIPFGPVSERGMSEMLTLFPDSSIRRSTVVRPPNGAGAAPYLQGWQAVGNESVTTAAGTFAAKHWQRGEEELWTAASAGPIGVVRYRGPDVQVELVGHGATGAKSRIPS